MSEILSASKLKTLKSCSWLYWCNYGDWKLPKSTNDGARRGQVVHSLFECLLDPKHHFLYYQIRGNKSIIGLPAIERFVRRKMKTEGITDKIDNKGNNNFELIDEMIQVGLGYDFLCKTGKLEQAETEFFYENPELEYAIRGFIDKIASHDDHIKIYDYKTSARVFEGEDLESNVQALMYSLYAKRVRKQRAVIRFIFLRFPENPMYELEFDEKTIEGFEQYLSYITKYIKGFNLDKAYDDFAADHPHPKKGEGFKGPLLCGYGKFPGHANKDGQIYWVCDFKWAFDYYALINKNTKKVIKTSFEFQDLVPTDDSFIEKRHYGGCPKWQNKI